MKGTFADYRLSMYWTRLQVGVLRKKPAKEVFATNQGTPLSFPCKIMLCNEVASELACLVLERFVATFDEDL